VARASQVVVGEYKEEAETSPTAATQPITVEPEVEPAADSAPAPSGDESLDEILARIAPDAPKTDEEA
jgi:hypothetical protein